MNTRKILFPCDLSTKEAEALKYAASLARERAAELLIVHVNEPPVVYGEGMYYYGVPEPDSKAIETMLAAVRPEIADVKYEHRLVDGDPATEIVALAKREGVELIVMSSHGRTGLGRLLMGSVAETVMREAECPVLIVKPKVMDDQKLAVGRPR